MSSCICKDIGIGCLPKVQGKAGHELMIYWLNMQYTPIKLKNSKLNENLKIKKNINLYILLQIIFPLRGCL